MRADRSHGAPRSLPAQALVEFVLCAPLVLLLLFCLVDGASLFRAGLLARGAATEAASYCSQNPDATVGQIEEHVRSSLANCPTDGISISVGSVRVRTDRYTMRVKQKDGWRSVEAFSLTSSRSITCSVGCRLFMPTIVGGDPHVSESATMTSSSTKEGTSK